MINFITNKSIKILVNYINKLKQYISLLQKKIQYLEQDNLALSIELLEKDKYISNILSQNKKLKKQNSINLEPAIRIELWT